MRGRFRLVAVASAILLAGCSQFSVRDGSFDFSHVHGLGYDPGNQTIYVATHHGLILGTPNGDGWTWDHAGAERYDYMGFTQDATNASILYSSGHPDDPRAYGGVHLGVRRSTDGGVTWEQRSLKGQVDFHALDSVPGLYGGLVGVWRDSIMESRDGGLTWTNHTGPAALMFDLAATSGKVYVATADGLASGQVDNRTSWIRHPDPEPGRPAMAIAANDDGSLLFAGTGNGRSGGTYSSTDGGHTWALVEKADLRDTAVPAVFAFDSGDNAHVFAATSAGTVVESTDRGGSWHVIRQA